ncbi:MAG: DUF1570 domain-containing protein [Planctomycetes bacterium]|nr:DUF1570 domain-containing protein [Planctomycetota bacterium]
MKRLTWGFVGAIALSGAWLATRAEADVIHLAEGGKLKGDILREDAKEVVIRTATGERTISRFEIMKIVREQSAQDTLRARLKTLKGSRDPDAFYDLGQWAEKQGLPKGARHCYEEAIKVDAYHRGAHEALGHRYYQGRWYNDEDYQRAANGLVEWKGQWVTPQERELYEQGFVKDSSGLWVRPGEIDRREPVASVPASARKPKRSEPKAEPEPEPEPEPKARPRRPQPEPKAGEGDNQEDREWYQDNFKTGEFASAPEIESRFYKIKTNVRPEYAKRYGEMMDQYYKRFVKVFKDYLPNGDLAKSTIWVYSSQQEFQAATGMGMGVGGFYNTGNKRVTGYHGLFGQNGTTRTVLAHEGTHQFEDIVLQGSFGNCPIWILEGLAVFFESAYYDGDDIVIGLVPRDRLASLKRGLQDGTLIPLSDLIRTPQPQFTAYHYAHAWSLIYMVLYYGKNKTIRKRCQTWFSSLMMDSRKGPVTAEMVEERCGGADKFLELEEKWMDWLEDLPYDYDPTK